MQNTFILQSLCAEIDRCTEILMNELLHHPRLQNLESTWRALNTLVVNKGRERDIRIKLLNLQCDELKQDLAQVASSHVFKLIYEQEFDQAGGEPYALLVIDLPLHPANIQSLTRLAEIAAQAFCIMLLPASNTSLEDEAREWESLRQKPESGFLALCLGRVKARENYTPSSQHEIIFEESQRPFLFKQSIWLYAQLVMHSFIQHGWFYDLNKPPSYNNELAWQAYSEPLCEERYYPKETKKLAQQGFICLLEHPHFQQNYFSSQQSVYAHTKINGIHSVGVGLCFGRIAHHLKILLRNKLTTMGKTNCEQYLQNWIQNYCARTNQLNPHSDFKYPIEAAKIQLSNNEKSMLSCHLDLQLKNGYPTVENTVQIKSVIAS